MMNITNQIYPPAILGLTAEDQQAEIVISGGGPIGLWSAIQMRVLTGKRIVVLEKHSHYQRSDIRLQLDPASFKGIPYDPGLNALVADWKQKKVVPIKEMEEGLARRASELGIRIIRGHTVIPEDLPHQFPNSKIFIGADGARSEMRKKYFNDQFRFNTTLQHIVQVQYVASTRPPEVPGTVLRVQNFMEKYSTQKLAKHLIQEAVRPLPDGKSHVTLQIFVNKGTYEAMSDASFRAPYFFDTDLHRLPKPVADALIKWWGVRELKHGEIIEAEAGRLNKITVIALGSYASREVVKVIDGKIFALAGDSGSAFPFFVAINNGLKLSTELARCAAAAFAKNVSQPHQPLDRSYFNSYSRYATWRAYVEYIKAYVKNIFLVLYNIWIKVSSLVPWQTVKWSQGRKAEIMNVGKATWVRLTGHQPAM